MTKSPVRVGVVGVGVMGGYHVRAYSEMPDVLVAGVFDQDQTRAAYVTEQFGGKVYSNVESLIDDVDALTIATPTSYHAAVALEALERSKHILIEKPLAQSIEVACTIAEAAECHPDVIVNVGHIERFNPVITALKECIDGRSVERTTFRRTTPFHGRSLDIDVIHDLMIHDIDLALGLFGTARGGVHAEGSVHSTDQIDEASARFTAQSGTRVTLIASRVSKWKARAIELLTDDSWIVADLLSKTITTTPYRMATNGSNGSSTKRHVRVVADSVDPLRAELQHFLDCIRTGSRSPVDVRAGLAAMRLAGDIRSSIPDYVSHDSRDRTSVHA
jgi:predicted dehydrogenase